MIEKISKQFEENQLFRRLIVVFVCALTAYATYESFEYANNALGKSGVETAAIIAAVQVPITYIMKFITKFYWSGRNVNVD